MQAMGLDDRWPAHLDEELIRRPKVAEAAQVDELKAEKKRLTDAFIAGAVEEGEWRGRIGTIDRRLAVVCPKPSSATAHAKLRSFAELWNGAPDDVRREACRIVFQQVVADMPARTLRLKPWDEFRDLFDVRRAFFAETRPRA